MFPAGHEGGLRGAGDEVNEIVLVEVDGEQRGRDIRPEPAVCHSNERERPTEEEDLAEVGEAVVLEEEEKLADAFVAERVVCV